MGSSRKRQRTEYFNSVHIIDFNQLLTLKLWETPKDDQARVYLQPSDETETNRDGFMEKFTVGSEIFNLLLLIKNQLVLEDSDQTTAHEIQLSKVESNILTALLNFASFISTNEIELDKFSNVDDVSILFKLLDAANFIDFNILIKLCIKTILQKFDFNSLDYTVENLQLEQSKILNHKSSIQNNGITLEAVFHQIETQYRVVPDMMNQIYKSIPLSVIVRLKASAKIIGLLFIAFTSDEAYTSNYEIEISLDHKEAETKGNEILNAFNNEKFSIKNLLPKFGYKLDDNGNKHLITDEDEYEDEDDEESFLEAATHPYIFEFIWSIFLRDPQIYFQSVYCKFNRRDIIEIIYESTKRLEDVELNKRVSDILNNELSLAVIHGHILSTKYLVDIVRADITKFFYSRHFQDVFRIKDREKRLRFLDFLYYSKVRCWHHEFEYQAKEGNYENVVWLVKHGYKGWLTIQIVEEQGALDIRKLQVLSYLRSNRKWEELTYSSRGNFNGPKPRTF